MSQKKMDAYKEAKKNVKQIRKKEKANRILAWIIGIICAAALIAGSVFLIYYTNVIKPEKEKAASEAQVSDDASSGIVDQVNSALETESSDDTTEVVVPADDATEEESDSAAE